MADRAEKRVSIGRVVGVFGVKGWLKIQSYTEPRENIFAYTPWFLSSADESREFMKVKGQAHGKGVIAHLQGLDDRDRAAKFVGWDISVERKRLPPSPEGEYYWDDLVGQEVITTTGQRLGRVDHLLATGANDVLVVEGDRQRLIPFLTDRVIKAVDFQEGVITVDWDPEF